MLNLINNSDSSDGNVRKSNSGQPSGKASVLLPPPEMIPVVQNPLKRPLTKICKNINSFKKKNFKDFFALSGIAQNQNVFTNLVINRQQCGFEPFVKKRSRTPNSAKNPHIHKNFNF